VQAGRVKGVATAQLHKPRIPCDDVAVAPRDRRAKVVDALARDTAQPCERAGVAFEERLDHDLEAELRVDAQRTRRADQRVNTPLAPRDS
jgi:hypothetical protein